MNCIVCGDKVEKRLKKENVQYYQCNTCSTLFSKSLPNDNMVGGGYEIERNEIHNQDRIFRIKEMLGGKKILDYGCGNGLLVEDMKKSNLICDGYDKYNSKFDKITYSEYDVVVMVEVIEHLGMPFSEIDEIYSLLKPGGFLYLETSFVDIAKQENIELEDFFYISPSVGHSTIFSHRGLDILMIKKGFKLTSHINRNVRVYQK
jgi:2-polyprenyl-3-methyl-5-hydroxy-6-metoxy-1,4-benzoquinol methylase